MEERFVTGSATYLDDVVPPDCLAVCFIRSDYPHARIRSMELRGYPQETLISGADLQQEIKPLRFEGPGSASYDWFPLSDTALYVGEPIGLVFAKDRYEAEDIASQVLVDYEPLQPITDVETALSGSAVLHPELSDNILYQRAINPGTADEALSRAPVIVEGTFHHHRQTAVPLEPRGVIASWDPNAPKLTVWTSTQMPWSVRIAVAEALGLREEEVRVIKPDVGGSFGQKAAVYAEEIAIAWLAMRTGRPVKWVEDRRESLIAAQPGREAEVALKVGADSEGRLLAVKAKIRVDNGAHYIYPFSASLNPMTAVIPLFGPYRLDVLEVEALAVATNKATLGSYRGVGIGAGIFATERAMDMLASSLGIDPAEIRLRNLLTKEDLPYSTPLGATYETGDFRENLRLALEMAGYANPAPRGQGSSLQGIGIACFNKHSGTGSRDYLKRGVASFPAYDSASIHISPDGLISVSFSSASTGQGHISLARRLVAERFTVPPAKVKVLEGDTDRCPTGFGSGCDRGAIAIEGAVLTACDRLLDKMNRIAAQMLEADGGVVLDNGHFSDANKRGSSVSFDEIVRAAYYRSPQFVPPSGMSPGLDATVVWDLEEQVSSNSAHVAFIELDPETAKVQVRRYVAVTDCGRILDPEAVEGQIRGGIVQGVGEALLEEVVYDDDGQILTSSLMDYFVPAATDVPTIELRQNTDPVAAANSEVKGIGNSGTVGVPAAVSNAVANALKSPGVAPNEVPLTPQRIFRLLEVADRSE